MNEFLLHLKGLERKRVVLNWIGLLVGLSVAAVILAAMVFTAPL